MFTCIVDNSGYFVDIFLTNELPSDIEDGYHLVDGALPNNIFMDSQNLPRWDGEKWIATGQAPEPQPHEPTELDLLQAQVQASSDYVDFLEDVVVELIQAVYQ